MCFNYVTTVENRPLFLLAAGKLQEAVAELEHTIKEGEVGKHRICRASNLGKFT